MLRAALWGCVGRGDLTPPRMCAARESARADMQSAPTVVVGRCRAASPLAAGWPVDVGGGVLDAPGRFRWCKRARSGQDRSLQGTRAWQTVGRGLDPSGEVDRNRKRHGRDESLPYDWTGNRRRCKLAGEQCSPLQEFFDILSNTQSPSRVRPGWALRVQEAYSRSSVSIKCTGSMMRRPSALGAAVSSRACSISSFVRAGATCQPSAMTPTQ